MSVTNLKVFLLNDTESKVIPTCVTTDKSTNSNIIGKINLN